MKYFISKLTILLISLISLSIMTAQNKAEYVIVIHGGAGVITKNQCR